MGFLDLELVKAAGGCAPGCPVRTQLIVEGKSVEPLPADKCMAGFYTVEIGVVFKPAQHVSQWSTGNACAPKGACCWASCGTTAPVNAEYQTTSLIVRMPSINETSTGKLHTHLYRTHHLLSICVNLANNGFVTLRVKRTLAEELTLPRVQV